jgi:hypothetical protein
LLAGKIIKLYHSQYALTKEKVEIIKQFEEGIAINERKLEEALECFIQNPPKSTLPKRPYRKKPKSRKIATSVISDSPSCSVVSSVLASESGPQC